MKLKRVLFGIIITLMAWHYGEAGTIRYNRQANRKQRKLIEGSMDLKADPCNDFYKYACGNWDQVHTKAGENYFEPITLLDYNVNLEMSLAFNDFSIENKPKFIKEALNYYKSCEGLEKYEAIHYFVWLEDNDNFKWSSWREALKRNDVGGWVQLLAKMRTYGFNDVFIQQIVMPKVSDVEKFIVDLDKPVANGGFKPITKENLKVLIDSLPFPMKTKDLDALWQEIEDFEKKLQYLDTIEDPADVENEAEYEKERLFCVKDLPLNWLKDYLKVILNQTELNDEMQLYLQNIPYMKALDELIKQQTERFVRKYLQIRFLWYLHTNGPANFIDEDCLASARSLMPTAMHWQYEQMHPELYEEYSPVYDIFNAMRKYFNNTVIANKHGFNATVLEYLQNKINHMKLRLNNIPRVDTIATLEKFYEDLNLHDDKFYENHLKLLRFNFISRRHLLSSKRSTTLDYTYLENTDTGGSSSPYFIQNANTVFVPLSLLQPPIYSPGTDDIYKYSSLGFLLAHEMFHGFDDSGLLTGANGTIALIKFEENPLFNASLNCLLEINPEVISEKIADISGLRYAYQAYFGFHANASTQTYTLHGQPISSGKLFFLNFAQFFCGEGAEEVISLSEHGSDRDRIKDALSHFAEFSNEFKCNSSHRLYPHETCHLWR